MPHCWGEAVQVNETLAGITSGGGSVAYEDSLGYSYNFGAKGSGGYSVGYDSGGGVGYDWMAWPPHWMILLVTYKWFFLLCCFATFRLLSASSEATNCSSRAACAACNRTFFTSPGRIEGDSQVVPTSTSSEGNICEYNIEADTHEVISLNLSRLYGFDDLQPPESRNAAVGSGVESTSHCLPRLELTAVTPPSSENVLRVLCRGDLTSWPAPRTLETSAHIIRVTYVWAPGQRSGFAISYRFTYSQSVGCVFRCHNGECLQDKYLVCNNVVNCRDGSDESQCGSTMITGEVSSNLTQIIVIVVSTLLVIAVIPCCLFYYRLSRRHPLEGGHGCERNRLDPVSLQQSSTEVVYVDRYNHHQVAVYPQDGNHQTALQAVQQGEPPPNLPPSIPLSDDGEFPYAYSQRHLHTSCHFDVNRESVCPPPNRTIHDAESPPSYRSHSVGSVGQLDRSLSSVSSTGSVPNAGRHLDTGTTPVVRCNSMSNNNNKTRNWNIQPPAYSRHDLNAHSPRTVQRPAPGRTHLGHLRVDSSGSNVQYASPPPPSLGQTMPSLSTSSDNATVNANLDVFNNRHSNSNV